jgi:predicted ATP-binding protein involved in virulence
MIVYSDSFIDGWNRKIIYAPNGFGKTTSAKQIALNLQKKNIRVGLFTRREIEELVQDFDDKLYMGIDAKTLVEKMRIEEAYSKADPLKKYAKQHCSASTVSAAKKNELLF